MKGRWRRKCPCTLAWVRLTARWRAQIFGARVDTAYARGCTWAHLIWRPSLIGWRLIRTSSKWLLCPEKTAELSLLCPGKSQYHHFKVMYHTLTMPLQQGWQGSRWVPLGREVSSQIDRPAGNSYNTSGKMHGSYSGLFDGHFDSYCYKPRCLELSSELWLHHYSAFCIGG